MNKKPPRDVFFVLGCICVSDKVREIIDSFEPGLHVFYPIAMLDRDGSLYEGRKYYILLSDVWLNAIFYKSEDRTLELESKFSADRVPFFYYYFGQHTISGPEMGDHHLWRQLYADHGKYYMSPILYQTFKSERILKIRYTDFQVSTMPWNVDENMGRMLNFLEENRGLREKFISISPQWARKYRPQWFA